MKLKILTIAIMLVMICSVLAVSADVEENGYINKSLGGDNTVEIRVAIYDDHLDINNDKESGGGKYLIFPLRNYEWDVGDRSYNFTIDVLSTKDILKGELNASNYDAFIYSWAQVDKNLAYTGFSRLPANEIRVREIRNFIKDGGGYFGVCGGALIAGSVVNNPDTFFERAMKKSSLGISCFTIEYHTDNLLLQMLLGEPSSIGTGAYLSYSGYKIGPDANPYSGISVDCNISKDNPIFDDLIEETRKINWIGATSFIPPEKPDRDTMVLARFPEIEFSDNETTKINQWKYTGGLSGLIKAFIHPGTGSHWFDNFGRFGDAFVFATDWVNIGNVIETNVANKPFMTAEIYPNSNQARIVRCSGHLEFNVWWGGHIEAVEDNDQNNIYEGFYKWVNVTPSEETIEDEDTFNYWIIRRSIAWASQKVPDNDLPSIYGPSQVSDIYPYNQSSEFDVTGNAEVAEGIVSLDLHYRYSTDNKTWNPNWTYYGTDIDNSDGWSWEFNAPNGTGHYQFYSIRRVKYYDHIEIETAPLGPDAIAYVEG